MLWSPDTGFILNVNIPENIQEFIKQDYNFQVSYSDIGLGADLSGTFDGNVVTHVEGTGHMGSVQLTLSPDNKHNLGLEIYSGSHTIGLLSFSGALSINNVSLGLRKGIAADGMAMTKTNTDAYLKMMMHQRNQSKKQILYGKALKELKSL